MKLKFGTSGVMNVAYVKRIVTRIVKSHFPSVVVLVQIVSLAVMLPSRFSEQPKDPNLEFSL
jgi:hypothetical protein